MEILLGLLFLIVLFAVFILLNMRVLKEGHLIVVERLGSFHRIIEEPGIHFFIPFVDRPLETLKKGTLVREVIASSTVYVCTFEIIDPKRFVYAYPDTLIEFDKMIQGGYGTMSDPLVEECHQMGIRLMDITQR